MKIEELGQEFFYLHESFTFIVSWLINKHFINILI